MNQFGELLQLLAREERLSAREIGGRLGISRARAANLLRVARLGEPFVSWVLKGQLTTKHGEELLRLPSEKRQDLARRAMAGRWPVAKLKAEVDRGLGKLSPDQGNADADLAALERRLGEMLGTAVEIRHDTASGSGVLSIKYTNADTMAGVLERLGWRED